jgi:hypothetical protein
MLNMSDQQSELHNRVIRVLTNIASAAGFGNVWQLVPHTIKRFTMGFAQ